MIQFSHNTPDAYAKITGSPSHPNIRGMIYFYEMHDGTLVVAELDALPGLNDAAASRFLGFHIHAGGSCTGDAAEPFKNADGHYNPANTEHPDHAGDLPPLLACGGMAWSAVYTNRFHPEDIIGKTVIVHELPDDFHSQPSGNSGPMIACGEILE